MDIGEALDVDIGDIDWWRLVVIFFVLAMVLWPIAGVLII